MTLLDNSSLNNFLKKELSLFLRGKEDFSGDFIKLLGIEIRRSVLFSKEPFRTLLNRDFDIFLREKETVFVHPFKVDLFEIIKEVRRISISAFPEDKLIINKKLNPAVINLRYPFLWGIWYSYSLTRFEEFSPVLVVGWGFFSNK